MKRLSSSALAVGIIAPAVILVIGMVAATNLAVPEFQTSNKHQ